MSLFDVYSYTRMFENLSQTRPTTWFTYDEAVSLNAYVIERWGGRQGEVRDDNLLRNIFFDTPYNDNDYDEGKKSLYDFAAEYMWQIAARHPFVDGNKRTAVGVALMFLADNKVKTRFDPVLLEQLVKKCANSHAVEDYDGIHPGYSFSMEKAKEEFLKCRI
jgi:death on curing protein